MATDATAAERRMIMPKNVVCKKCNNLVNDWCEKVIDSPDPDMQRDCQYFWEKTNADRVRAMNAEQLAEWALFRAPQIGREYSHSLIGLITWLQQPAEEG